MLLHLSYPLNFFFPSSSSFSTLHTRVGVWISKAKCKIMAEEGKKKYFFHWLYITSWYNSWYHWDRSDHHFLPRLVLLEYNVLDNYEDKQTGYNSVWCKWSRWFGLNLQISVIGVIMKLEIKEKRRVNTNTQRIKRNFKSNKIFIHFVCKLNEKWHGITFHASSKTRNFIQFCWIFVKKDLPWICNK